MDEISPTLTHRPAEGKGIKKPQQNYLTAKTQRRQEQRKTRMPNSLFVSDFLGGLGHSHSLRCEGLGGKKALIF
ncbi:MAG TPA: hypothetical protein VK859_07915 [bacterium]|nr:hypothetical protein [bacterium]